jgi:A/G-specific adenine glycosylase
MSILVEKIDAMLARPDTLSPQMFQRVILDFYRTNGRTFAWRTTTNAYRIAVSEVMLQQTQTERVSEKYPPFIKRFPTWKSLAKATTAEVISMWQGLGYYRRALHLHRAAKVISEQYHGRLPGSVKELQAIPGFGPYTSAAVLTFSKNEPLPMLETNIRDLYLYTFFSGINGVHDREILEKVRQTIYHRDPRRWFYALMDAGVELKRARKGTNRRSRHYTRQSAFMGSTRQVRAAVLKLLAERGPLNLLSIAGQLAFGQDQIEVALEALCRDGFISPAAGARYRLT